MTRKRILVYVGVSLTMIFWSLSYILIKMVYRFLNPISTVFLRLAASAVILLAFTLIARKLQKIERGDGKYVVLVSFFQPFCYFIFESFGLKYVSPTVAAVIVSTIPLFVPIAAFYFLKERLSRMNVLGMTVSFMGVLAVIVKWDLSFAASPLGVLLLLLAVASGTAFNIAMKNLASKYSALTLVTYQNILGALWFIPLVLIFDLDDLMAARFTMELILPLAMLVVFASTLAFLFFTAALKELGASRTTVFGNMIPVFTAIFSWLLLAEPLTIRTMVGIVLVMGGLFLSQVRRGGKKG